MTNYSEGRALRFLTTLRRRNHSEAGFTLLELMVVVLVVGILSAIAIPVFLNQQTVAVQAAVRSDVRSTVTQAALAATTHEPGKLTAYDEHNEAAIHITRYDRFGNPVVTATPHKVVASERTDLEVRPDTDPSAGPTDFIVQGWVEGTEGWSYTYTSRLGTFTATDSIPAAAPSEEAESVPAAVAAEQAPHADSHGGEQPITVTASATTEIASVSVSVTVPSTTEPVPPPTQIVPATTTPVPPPSQFVPEPLPSLAPAVTVTPEPAPTVTTSTTVTAPVVGVAPSSSTTPTPSIRGF